MIDAFEQDRRGLRLLVQTIECHRHRHIQVEVAENMKLNDSAAERKRSRRRAGQDLRCESVIGHPSRQIEVRSKRDQSNDRFSATSKMTRKQPAAAMPHEYNRTPW